MPIIERIIKKDNEEIKELIADVPDKSGRYPTAYGEMEIILGPVIAKKSEVCMRKVILKGGLIGDRRRMTEMHPSYKKRLLMALSETEFLSIRSQPEKAKKGRERFAQI